MLVLSVWSCSRLSYHFFRAILNLYIRSRNETWEAVLQMSWCSNETSESWGLQEPDNTGLTLFRQSSCRRLMKCLRKCGEEPWMSSKGDLWDGLTSHKFWEVVLINYCAYLPGCTYTLKKTTIGVENFDVGWYVVVGILFSPRSWHIAERADIWNCCSGSVVIVSGQL